MPNFAPPNVSQVSAIADLRRVEFGYFRGGQLILQELIIHCHHPHDLDSLRRRQGENYEKQTILLYGKQFFTIGEG